MLNLNYIIIGDLPEDQRSCLEQNLIADGIEKQGVQTVVLEKAGESVRLEQFPFQESIFISGDFRELQMAIDLGMATLGYLPDEKSARGQFEKQYDNIDYNNRETCPNTDMWAEGFEEIGWKFLVRVYERCHGLPWTILETKRCVVKEFSMEYLDDLFALYTGEGMTDYIEPLYPYEQEKAYQEAYIKNMYGFYGYGMWIVCEKQSGRLIGRAGLEHREELGGEMELGYAIGVPYQRKGYATEVCTAILKYAKEELLQPSVCCLIEDGNLVSEHLAEKLGFLQTGVIVAGEKQMKKYTCVFRDLVAFY